MDPGNRSTPLVGPLCALLFVAACGGGDPAPDDGMGADAGASSDAGGIPDAGTVADAANDPDAGESDAGVDGGELDTSAGPHVGVNYNGQLDAIDFGDLERTGTTWVRGFIDFFLFFDDPGRLEDDPRILNYLQLKERGYRTILNIKWDFRERGLPDPGSAEMVAYEAFLEMLLDRVWDGTDIIVAGNEPFIETRRAEQDAKLVPFYAEVTSFLKDYGDRDGTTAIPIYVGAFNNLYLESWRTEPTLALIELARTDPAIAGIDLHVHHAHIEELDAALGWVHDRIRADQRILITEYSLMKHWRSKMGERIPEAFAAAHGWAPDTRNYQYIDHALKNPVPRAEWLEFLSGSYWFENRTRYLRNCYQRFRTYEKVYVGTYAMRQSYPFGVDFTVDTDPWILNAIYANRTVEPDPASGGNQLNYAWFDDFQRIQDGTFD